YVFPRSNSGGPKKTKTWQAPTGGNRMVPDDCHLIFPENQMPDSELAFASATEQLRLLERGEASASGLLELYLDRIDRLNGDYNLVVAFDRERARATAADIDARRKRG